MKVRVQKWGNGLAIRLPKTFAREVGINPDSIVELSFSEGELIVRPVMDTPVSLTELLDKVTPENLHDEFETGPSVGVEAW